MAAYYNEIDPYAAQWLRNLIMAGHIAPGDVDERSIRDVRATDLVGYTQCHFFAGIGVWSYALRLAGIPDDYPVWTGSCPCQPFSVAGKKKGQKDDRHLWPEFFRLINACRPSVVMGEQVASKDGLAWLDLVYADLEGARYAVRAADTCAAGFGAPHIRQRLYWCGVAEPMHTERGSLGGSIQDGHNGSNPRREKARSDTGACGEVCGLADAEHTVRRPEHQEHGGSERAVGETGVVDRMANTDGRIRCEGKRAQSGVLEGPRTIEPAGVLGPVNGFWHPADWLPCRDGKARPVEPGTFPLAHGAPARVGRLRAYGNAIVAPQAAAFIEAIRPELIK